LRQLFGKRYLKEVKGQFLEVKATVLGVEEMSQISQASYPNYFSCKACKTFRLMKLSILTPTFNASSSISNKLW